MKKIIFIVIALILIFGTNNYQELNNLAIITNIGIEKHNNLYTVTFQELIPKREENKIIKTYKYYQNKNNSLSNTFKSLDQDITKDIYLDHLENIIINTDNDNIIDSLLDYFKNDLDNFNIIYTPNDPKKIMNYSINYKYPNSLIKNNISFRSIKKSKLENKNIKIPVIKLNNKKLVFYKYKELNIK